MALIVPRPAVSAITTANRAIRSADEPVSATQRRAFRRHGARLSKCLLQRHPGNRPSHVSQLAINPPAGDARGSRFGLGSRIRTSSWIAFPMRRIGPLLTGPCRVSVGASPGQWGREIVRWFGSACVGIGVPRPLAPCIQQHGPGRNGPKNTPCSGGRIRKISGSVACSLWANSRPAQRSDDQEIAGQQRVRTRQRRDQPLRGGACAVSIKE